MADIIIIHGSYGSPDENWFPWLKKELRKIGLHVHVPRFPTPANQNLDNWLAVFKHHRRYVNENTVFVGHSLGPAFILTVIEGLLKPVRAAFLVAGFLGKLGISEFDGISDTFTNREFDWDKIRQNCRHFVVYASDNDSYVPLEKSKQLAEKLGAELKIIKNAGHFNEEAGYLKFDSLLGDVREATG